jgi:hypothetical protein
MTEILKSVAQSETADHIHASEVTKGHWIKSFFSLATGMVSGPLKLGFESIP